MQKQTIYEGEFQEFSQLRTYLVSAGFNVPEIWGESRAILIRNRQSDQAGLVSLVGESNPNQIALNISGSSADLIPYLDAYIATQMPRPATEMHRKIEDGIKH